MVDSAVFYAFGPIFVVASLAMPAGIGGGLLYVPLLVIIGVVDTTSSAAALGQPLICGATLAAVAYNIAWQRRHPEKRIVRPELALAAIPACLSGAMVGVVVNQVLPDALIHFLLLVVLSFTIRKSLQKAVAMWRQENGAKPSAKPARDPEDGEKEQSAAASTSDVESNRGPLDVVEEGKPRKDPDGDKRRGSVISMCSELAVDEELDVVEEGKPRKDPDGDKRRGSVISMCSELAVDEEPAEPAPGAGGVPAPAPAPQPAAAAEAGAGGGGAPMGGIRDWLLLLGVYSLLVLNLVLRGGKGASSVIGVKYCSWEYWLISGIAFVALLVAEFFTRRTDVPVHTCFWVGCISAVAGIGGGIVLNPMFLAANYEPLIVTATVTVMIVMISSSATLNFVLVGAVPVVPTLVLFSATFLGSLVGKSVVGWIVAKTGRNSFVVFLLAGFMSVSSVVVAVQGVLEVVSTVSGGENPLVLWSEPCGE